MRRAVALVAATTLSVLLAGSEIARAQSPTLAWDANTEEEYRRHLAE